MFSLLSTGTEMFNNLVKIRGGQPRPKQAQRKFYRLLDQTNLMYFQDCLSMAQRSRHLSSWSSKYFKQCKTSVLKCWFITGRFSSSFYFTKTILLTNSPEVFSVFVMALFSNNLLILFFFCLCFCFSHMYWTWGFNVVWNPKKNNFVPFYNWQNLLIFS